MMRIVAHFGTGPIAGFGIAMHWYSLKWVLLSGSAAAASILVGLNGMWYAMLISLLAESGINLAWYKLGAWKEKDPTAGEQGIGVKP